MTASIRVGVCFGLTILAIFVLYTLRSELQFIAWLLFFLGIVAALILLALHTHERLTSIQNRSDERATEMIIRRERYYHHTETPLDREGYPTHLQKGQQPYYHARRKEGSLS